MRRINLRFAALLLVGTAAFAGGFHLLHVYQHDRIAQSLLWQVQKCRDDGQTDQAIKFAGQYLDFNPGDVQVMSDLATWLAKRAKDRRQLTGVARLYERILRTTPEDAVTRLKAADLYALLGQYYKMPVFGEALDHLSILIKEKPGDPKLLTLQGFCQSAVGKHAAAEQSYRAAMQAAPQDSAAYVHLAGLYQTHLNKPPAEVEKVLDAALKANPQSALAHAGRARFLRNQNKFADAARAIEQARAFGKNEAEVILAASEIAQASGDMRKARELLEEGAKLYPQNVRFAFSLAWLQLHEGRGELALATLREAQKINPKDPDLLTLLGDILAREGQVEPLQAVLKDLTAQKASAERVNYIEARLLMRRGRFADAAAKLDTLRGAALRSPALYRQANHLLAQCYEHLGDSAGELEAFRRLFEVEPNAHATRLDHARALARAGKSDEAIREFVAAVRPDSPARGVAETARFFCERYADDARNFGEFTKAVDSLKLDDVNPNATLARAELDRARGRPGDALEHVSRALQKNIKVIALHTARVALIEQGYGVERALLALEESEQRFAAADFRVQRIRLTARRGDRNAAPKLFALAQNLDKFAADDRLRILRELVAAYRLFDDKTATAQHLKRIAESRPDYLPAREALALAALKAGDETARKMLLAEIEQIEGPDGAGRLTHDAVVALTKDDVTGAGAKLAAAAKLQPRNATVEFLRGRVAELGNRADAAAEHYRTAFRAGLLDAPPVEELLACMTGNTTVLREELAANLRPERHPTAVLAALPLYDAAGREKLAGRFVTALPTGNAVGSAALGRLFVRFGFDRQAEELYRRAAKSGPQSSDGWLALITEHARRKDAIALAKATADVRAALPAIQAHAIVGRGLEAAGRMTEARQEYEQALTLRPDDARSLRLLANLHLLTDRQEEAQKYLRTLADLRDDPAVADDVRWARRNLAVQLAASPSLRSFTQAINLLDANPSPAEDDQRARVIVLMAQKSRPLSGDRTCRQEAIRLLEGLQQRDTSRSADDLIQLAKLYRAENDDTKARVARERLRAEYGQDYRSLAFLAREAIRDHDLVECEKLVPHLRQLGPNLFETATIEFQCRTLAGEAKRACKLLSDFAAGGETEIAKKARARRAADLVYDFLQAYPLTDKAEAAALREFALKLFAESGPADPASLPKVATLLAQSGQTAPALEQVYRMRGKLPIEAVAAAQVAALRHGRPTPQQISATERFLDDECRKNPRSTILQLSFAEFYEFAGSDDKAVANYRAILGREPENIVALNNLAWTLGKRRTTALESLALIDRAVDLVGPADELLDTRSRIRIEMGRLDSGLRDLEDASLDSPSASRYAELAKLYDRTGKPERAGQALTLARRFGAP